MVFVSPAWVPQLPTSLPDSITVGDYLLDEAYGRCPASQSKAPFTCGISGKAYSVEEVRKRVDYLARGLAKDLNWHPNEGSEWDKVVAIFSANTIDTLTVTWATHRLSGISAPSNAQYTVGELERQMKSSGCKAIFTCLPLLQTSIEAAAKSGLPMNHIYIIDLPVQLTGGAKAPPNFKTVDILITEGSVLEPLEALRWTKGQGATQTAFLCTSSGTSGRPASAKVSHRNTIANIMQIFVYESVARRRRGGQGPEVCLGLLPFSHSFSLVAVGHASVYAGDGVIILPNFDMQVLLGAVQNFKIESLYLIPPILVALAKNPNLLKMYDLDSVTSIVSGAAALSPDVMNTLQSLKPSWKIRQGYGLTEASVVMSFTSMDDIWSGSCGCLLPSVEARLLSSDGAEIESHGIAGELLLRSPSIMMGFLNEDEATSSAISKDGWLKTGDVAMIKVSPNGTEHLFIVDRVKDIITVKGLQVAPTELEGHLLSHPAVLDCAVIPILDETSGELPKAFVIKSPAASSDDDATLSQSIHAYLEPLVAPYKYLKGGIEFVAAIPKNASGKILKNELKAAEEAKALHKPVQVYSFD
ncbi:MAG: hypothetical protein M1818_002697 [Claussenomyces sp. TS43310]|nr:MAG: hypothetical protein M1818_002697 [Claussenomyces sp. TS43310]